MNDLKINQTIISLLYTLSKKFKILILNNKAYFSKYFSFKIFF